MNSSPENRSPDSLSPDQALTAIRRGRELADRPLRLRWWQLPAAVVGVALVYLAFDAEGATSRALTIVVLVVFFVGLFTAAFLMSKTRRPLPVVPWRWRIVDLIWLGVAMLTLSAVTGAGKKLELSWPWPGLIAGGAAVVVTVALTPLYRRFHDKARGLSQSEP